MRALVTFTRLLRSRSIHQPFQTSCDSRSGGLPCLFHLFTCCLHSSDSLLLRALNCLLSCSAQPLGLLSSLHPRLRGLLLRCFLGAGSLLFRLLQIVLSNLRLLLSFTHRGPRLCLRGIHFRLDGIASSLGSILHPLFHSTGLLLLLLYLLFSLQLGLLGHRLCLLSLVLCCFLRMLSLLLHFRGSTLEHGPDRSLSFIGSIRSTFPPPFHPAGLALMSRRGLPVLVVRDL
mmetsp:Transcript_92951/g.248770  ORF Transcript_92951/g.248770 Transcript_92951/m.248770 type:complete len:231 (+) Transcript_92951:276-968(+)